MKINEYLALNQNLLVIIKKTSVLVSREFYKMCATVPLRNDPKIVFKALQNFHCLMLLMELLFKIV